MTSYFDSLLVTKIKWDQTTGIDTQVLTDKKAMIEIRNPLQKRHIKKQNKHTKSRWHLILCSL